MRKNIWVLVLQCLLLLGCYLGMFCFFCFFLLFCFLVFKYCFFLPVFSCLVQKLAGSGQVYMFALSVSHEIYSCI